MFKQTKDGILVTDNRFRPKDILECGQVFRYTFSNGVYGVYSVDKFAQILPFEDGYLIKTDFPDYFIEYFDLKTDYEKITDEISSYSPILKNAVEYGQGIRILKQDYLETLFSFIISANNNIKRIQLIIERLCVALGEKTKYGYAFPTLSALASVPVSFYTSIGAGYRDVNLYRTAQILSNDEKGEFSYQNLNTLNSSALITKLCRLYGVGEKVANCVTLFAFSRKDVFPVDTWIKKVYHEYFENGHADKDICKYLIQLFGDYSGYVQQYLFYYQRSKF